MNNPFEALLAPSEEKNTHLAPVSLKDVSGRYRIGPPARPSIPHDNGHLDMYPTSEPTVADRGQFMKWTAMLETSEALCNAQTGSMIGMCNGEDLSDANAAYRHFLFGDGKDRTINYERYLRNDPSGSELIHNLLSDFQSHVEIIGKDRVKFSVTSNYYTVGRGGIAPYPSTANWQKTIGAHFLWVSADVVVSVNAGGKIFYEADLVIYVEDRYNFNPGSTDVATGIPDSANGRFEVTGLAKQYTNYATVTRATKWEESSSLIAKAKGTAPGRQRMPSDNRRLRNRL